MMRKLWTGATLGVALIALGLASVVGTVVASPTCPANPFTLTNGTTADANQVMSIVNNLRTCISNAASNGANSDITSLSGLATPLTIGQGGTGAATGRAALQSLNGGFILGKSGTAVSAPADATEDILATITLPAGALGANGWIDFVTNWSMTNSANAKTLRVRIGGIGGTVIASYSGASVATERIVGDVVNANATNSQVVNSTNWAGGATSVGTSFAQTAAIDTTASTTFVVTGQKATAGETLTLTNYLFRLWSDGL